MDFTIERSARRIYICPHTPQALARVANWGPVEWGFPFSAAVLPALIEHLTSAGFQVQEISDVDHA